MKYTLYRILMWFRDHRREGSLRPVALGVVANFVLMTLHELLLHYVIGGENDLGAHVSTVLFTSFLAGVTVYGGLLIYRQMARQTMEEVSERLRLSRELLEERNLIHAILENTGDHIYFKDLDSRFIRVNDALARRLGLDRAADAVGKTDHDVMPKAMADERRTDEMEIIRTGRSLVGKLEKDVYPDSSTAWVSSSKMPLRDRRGDIVGTFGISRDISEAVGREQQLRKLSLAVEEGPTVVIITDVSGAIEYVNSRFTTTTGYSLEEVKGRNPRLLKSGQTPVHVYREMWETIKAGRVWHGDLLNRRKNGGVYWGRASIAPMRNEGGRITHFVGVMEDITDQRRAADALAREYARSRELESIIRRSPAVVFRWVRAPEWPVEYVSANVDQFGYAAEDLIAGRIAYSAIIHPQDLERVKGEMADYEAKGTPEFTQEYRILTRDGQVRWVDDRTWVQRDELGQITHYQGIVLDSTVRKLAEARQDALTRGLQKVLSMSNELMACTDEAALLKRAVELARQDLGFERCAILLDRGDSMQCTFGTSATGATTDERAHAFPKSERLQKATQLRPSFERAWMVAEEPYRIWNGSAMEEGRRGWVVHTPIETSGDEVLGLFCNDSAITAAAIDPAQQDVLVVFCSLLGNIMTRRRAETEQRLAATRQREVLERTDRLNSLGLLAAGMAHEINNPLQGMLSHLHGVQHALGGETDARRSLDMVERGIDSIAMLVRKLLVLGAAEEPGHDLTECGEAVDFVVQLLESQFRRARVRIERDVATPDARLAIPRREFIQVVTNLMINARDAMEEGGTISVSTALEGRLCVVSVRDTGSGIPDAVRPHLFVPFFTTKGTRGTGLGLSVADSLVRGCNGTITVESKVGQGSTFTIRLPLISGGAT